MIVFTLFHFVFCFDPILISFGTNISDDSWPSNDCLVSHLTHCLFLHYLRKKRTRYCTFNHFGIIAWSKQHTKHTFCPYFHHVSW